MGEKYPGAIHYSFVLLTEGKMSTRQGTLVLLEDFMDKSYEKAKKEIDKRYPKMNKEEKTDLAKIIMVAAVRYGIVKVSPEKNIIFNLENALKFDGNTGPYLQYTYARANSILKKAGKKSSAGKKLDNPLEIKLVKLIARYPEILKKVAEELRPHYLANYLFELANTFNEYYQNIRVIGSKNEKDKLKLVESVIVILKSGLGLLGIESPEKM